MEQCMNCGGTILVNNPFGIQEQVSDACICTNGGLVLQEQESQNNVENSSAPDCCVVSVNGKDGVVNLTTTNIPEGTNLYFTNNRARQAISAENLILYNFATGIIAHKLSGIIPNTYGSTTQYPVITVDEWGHITGISLKTLPNSTLDADLQAIADLNGQGYLIKVAPDNWVLRKIINTPGRTEILNGDGVNAQTRIDLAKIPTIAPNTYGNGTQIPVITVDIYGRIIAISTTPVLNGGTIHTHSLGELSNVSDTVDTQPATGAVLMWDGTQWNFGPGGQMIANNGLTIAGNIIKMGGVLTENTQINIEDYLFQLLSTNISLNKISGIKLNPSSQQNIVELFFNSGAQKSSIEVKETSIRQRVGINGLNMSYTEQSLSGIRIWGENSGILRDRFEVRTDNYVRAIKFNDYPSNRNDNITPLNFLHTNNTGELISSPVGAIRGDFEKVNFDINNINKLVIIDENLLQRFGTFPSITVFMLSSSNNYELFTTSIIYDAFPPTQIDVYLGGGIEGFIIIK